MPTGRLALAKRFVLGSLTFLVGFVTGLGFAAITLGRESLIPKSISQRDEGSKGTADRGRRNSAETYNVSIQDMILAETRKDGGGSESHNRTRLFKDWLARSKVAPWEWLLSIRSKMDPKEWNDLRAQLFAAARFEGTDDYIRIARTWDGPPDARVEFAALIKSDDDHTGSTLQKLVDEQADKNSFLIRLASQRNLGDWVRGADFLASQALQSEQKGALLDFAAISWGKAQGESYPAAWLLEPRNGSEWNAPRMWMAVDVYSESPGTAARLLADVDNESLRAEALMAIASTVSKGKDLSDLTSVAPIGTMDEIKQLLGKE